MYDNMQISVVIPLFNEEKRLDKTFQEIRSFVAQNNNVLKEVIFVDDGSSDQTVKRVSRFIEEKTLSCRLISLEKNYGKGRAVRVGMLEAQGDYVLMIDADMSTSLSELSKCLPLLEKKVPIIIGTRKAVDARISKPQPWYRQKMGEAYAIIARLLTGVRIKDFGCGFKLFSRESIQTIFKKAVINRWTFDTEILFLTKKQKLEVAEVGVVWQDDTDTRVHPFRDVFSSLYDLIRMRCFHASPLKTFGLLSCLLALGVMLPLLVHSNFSLLDDPYYLRLSHLFFEHDWKVVLGSYTGRSMPLTFFLYALLLKISSYRVFWFIGLRTLELAGTFFLFSYILQQWEVRKKYIVAALLVLATLPAVVSNYYELFTQDHFLLLFFLLFLSAFIKILQGDKNISTRTVLFSCLWLAAFMFSKEVTIVTPFILALVSVYLFVASAPKKIQLHILLLLLLSCLVTGIQIFSILHYAVQGVGSYSWRNILVTFKNFLPYVHVYVPLLLGGIFFLIKKMNITKNYDSKSAFVVFLFFSGVLLFGIYLPWGTVADRYTLVPLVVTIMGVVIMMKQINKKYVYTGVVLLLVLNIAGASFQAVRFFASRRAEGNLFSYLQQHRNEYGTVCVYATTGSLEDAIELHIFLDDILRLNKQICVIGNEEVFRGAGVARLLESEQIAKYPEVNRSEKIIILKKEYTGVADLPAYTSVPETSASILKYHIHSWHPKRGFEIKKFDWSISYL